MSKKPPAQDNILLVTASISRDGGGVSEAVRLLADALKSQKNIELTIVTTKDEYFDQDISRWEGHKIRAFKYFGPSNYRFSPGLAWYLLKNREGIAHVHGIWTFQCFVVLLRSIVTGQPYVVTPHGMLEKWILSRSRLLKFLVSTLYQNWFLKRASAFQALTQKEIKDISNFVPDARNIKRIPNYVPITDNATGLPPWWKSEFDKCTIYLFFGRIHIKKGWRELCAAWKVACNTNKDFEKNSLLVFCGWVDGSEDFEQNISDLQKKLGNVIFAGSQFGASKLQTFKAANFFILPSKSEGLPMVILEAWASGIPVLMSKECNLPDGFSSGAALQTGTKVNTIERALLKADTLTAKEKKNMSQAGRTLITNSYSAKVIIEGMKNIYETAFQSKQNDK